MNQSKSSNLIGKADRGRSLTPSRMVAGILPFILIGLMFTLLGINYHRPLTWMANGMAAYLGTHVLLLVGLGIGWAKGFPRWSYGYLGAVMMISIWLAGVSTLGFHLFGYTFGREHWGWRAWLALWVLIAVMLLLTRSPRLLAQLFVAIKQDWTNLSLVLYGAVSWLFMLMTYDGKTWYNQTALLPVNLLLLTLLIAGGAFCYMRERRQWPRVFVLQATLILFFLISALVTTLDGHTEFGSPSTIVGWLMYLFLILLWVSVPLAPGLVYWTWQHLRLI